MMKAKNLIIYILSLIMVMSLLTPVFTTTVLAADTKAEEKAKEEEGEEKKAAFDAAKKGYLTEEHPAAQSKLNTMSLYFEDDNYEIYGL